MCCHGGKYENDNDNNDSMEKVGKKKVVVKRMIIGRLISWEYRQYVSLQHSGNK